jgi:hypothetical protein
MAGAAGLTEKLLEESLKPSTHDLRGTCEKLCRAASG